MSSTARTSTALVLALAIAILASAVDRCVVFCIAQRPASANVPATCHHAGNSALQIGRVPTPCTHPHTGIVATVSADRSRFTRITGSIAAVVRLFANLDLLMFRQMIHAATPPGSPFISPARPLALRI